MIELVDTIAQVAIDFTNVAQAGPPSDLPGPVPDFVGDTLGSVRSFIGGSIDNLGEAVSDLTPGGK